MHGLTVGWTLLHVTFGYLQLQFFVSNHHQLSLCSLLSVILNNMVIVYVCSSPFSFDTIVTDVHVLFTTCSCLLQANHSLSQMLIELFSIVLTGINSVFSSTLTITLLRRSVQVKERDQVPARLQCWMPG